MRIRGKTKLGLGALVSMLFGLGGCKTTVTVGYEHGGSRLDFPVYVSKEHYVTRNLASNIGDGYVNGKSRLFHMIAGLCAGYGLGKMVYEESTSDTRNEEGIWTGIGVATAYTIATWKAPNYKWEWWVVGGGAGLGLLYPPQEADDNGNGGSSTGNFGGDPNEGDDGGSGDDGDQDDWDDNGSDSDQDGGNW